MAGDVTTIRDYLVGLGFKIDQAGYNALMRTLGDISAAVQKNANTITTTYLKAGSAVVGVLASITSATVAMMDKVAKADLEYQKFALRMFMSTDAAKKLKIATDALGESIEDIAWVPELRERYFELIKLQDELEGGSPEDFKEKMKMIRDMRFELTKMKVEGVYALQLIGYYLAKHLLGPGTELRKTLDDIIEKIHKKLKDPEWMKKIAKWLGIVISLFKSLIRFAIDFKEVFVAAAIAIGAYFAIGTPIGRAMTIIAALIMLIDDFYAYLDGRRSAKDLAPIWDKLIKALNIIDGLLTSIDKQVQKVGGWISLFFGPTEEELAVKPGDRGALSASSSSTAPKGFLGKGGGFKPWIDSTLTEYGSKGRFKRQAPPIAGNKGTVTPAKNIEILQAADWVSQKTGIPASLVYGQWVHETGNFTNRGATELNNFAGIKNPGGNDYRSFGSINEFSTYYAQLMLSRRYASAGVPYAKTPEEFAQALKQGGYYEDSAANYTAGLRRGMSNYTINNSVGGVTVNVTQPNASAEEIAAKAAQKMDERLAQATARLTREGSGVFN